jgi:hypothetical protein
MKPRKDAADRGAGSGCMARLVRCSSFSCESRVWILLLKLAKNFSPNRLNRLLRDSSCWQQRKSLVENTLHDAKPPLAHDEGLGDIDSAYGDGHGLFGGGLRVRCSGWPALMIEFPKVSRKVRSGDPNRETCADSKKEVAETKIPSGLHRGSPSNILTLRTLNDRPESNVSDIEVHAALRACEIDPHVFGHSDGGTVGEDWKMRSVTHASKISSTNALFGFFIFCSGYAYGGCAYGGDSGNVDKSALELLPWWVYALIFLGSPLLVMARLYWGPSPWDTKSHKEETKTPEKNEQGR